MEGGLRRGLESWCRGGPSSQRSVTRSVGIGWEGVGPESVVLPQRERLDKDSGRRCKYR